MQWHTMSMYWSVVVLVCRVIRPAASLKQHLYLIFGNDDILPQLSGAGTQPQANFCSLSTPVHAEISCLAEKFELVPRYEGRHPL